MGAMMRNGIRAAALCIAALAAPHVLAQAPDCRVLVNGAGTAQHAGEIVVSPSAAVTLEAHCTGSATPTYLWSTGATTSSIVATAPSTPAAQSVFTVDVTQGGLAAQFTATVRTAAAGTPVCSITRDPSGDLPVFTAVRLTAVCSGGASSFNWTGGYDLRGQGNASVVHVNILNQADTVPLDVIASNANGPGAVVGTELRYVLSPPACRILAAPPGRVQPNQSVTLSAQCDGSPTTYSWAHAVQGSAIVVNPAVTATYTLRASNAAGIGPAAVHIVPVSTTAPGLRDFTGHWWGGEPENGWGMTLNQHGQAIFGVIYFYDATGEPTWAVMPGGSWNSDFTVFTGDLYTPTGSPFTNYDASELVAGSPTGTLTLTMASPTQITASYRLGYSQPDANAPSITTFGQKVLTPLILNSGNNPAGLAVADMWWGGAAQNGWGISINQRSSEIFAAWFTYGADRRPTWFIISGSSWNANSLNGSIFRVTGSPWLGLAYDATRVESVNMGPATLGFSDRALGTFLYNVGPASGAKLITRQEF
jgi:hypothetical protein